MPTPSEKLGDSIVNRLIAEGLLTEEQGEHVLPDLVTGKVKPEDWRLAIEISDESEGDHDD